MIASDQPTIFDGDVVAAISSIEDGDMRFGRDDDAEITQNRTAFLKKVGIQPEQTTLVRIVYDDAEHFARYYTATDDLKDEGMREPSARTVADALVVTKPGHALFLPLADCAGMVLYDPEKRVLMVSHVGRHSAEIDGAMKSVNYLKEQFSSDPATLKVWVSPAVGKATYPLHARNNCSLHEVIREQLQTAGVRLENVEMSDIDTAENTEYFSHSQFLKGGRDSDGRFAIVAMMRD